MKNLYRILTLILMFGWIPFMILSVSIKNIDPLYGIILFASGLFICIMSLASITLYFPNNIVWKSLEEIDNYKKELREASEAYRKAEQKLLNKVLSEKD